MTGWIAGISATPPACAAKTTSKSWSVYVVSRLVVGDAFIW
jgi:hypothetical protein